MIPPFLGQWESAGRIADILSGALRAADDPLWPRSGAAGAMDYETWADHLCGVACLRMALAARGQVPPRAFDLARDLTARGGYVLQPDGAIRGLIYAPAVAWLRDVPRLAAEVRVDVPADAIPAMLGDGGMFIASVHPAIRRAEAEPPSRGGHLVLVFGAEDGALRFNNPSGDTAGVAARCPAAGRGIRPLLCRARDFHRGLTRPAAPRARQAFQSPAPLAGGTPANLRPSPPRPISLPCPTPSASNPTRPTRA